MSVQTKEVPFALSNLLKAKGQNVNRDSAVVQQPVAVIVETQHTEVPATPEPAPEPAAALQEPVVQATPEPAPEPSNGRDSVAYKELKQYHDKTVYELRTQNKQLETQLSQATAPKIEAPKTPEEMKEFKTKHKDAFDIMRTIVLEELGNSNAEIQRKIEDVNKAQNELKEKEAFKKLLETHPDALEIRQSPEFAKWFNEQPDDIKAILAKSTDINAVAKQLTLYKLEVLGINPKEKLKAEAQKREDNSLGVDVKGRTEITAQKKIWTGTEINKICSDYKLWLRHKDEIDAARREGRVDNTK